MQRPQNISYRGTPQNNSKGEIGSRNKDLGLSLRWLTGKQVYVTTGKFKSTKFMKKQGVGNVIRCTVNIVAYRTEHLPTTTLEPN
jgi:hypothetical protein